MTLLGKYTLPLMLSRVPERSFGLTGEGHVTPIPEMSARLTPVAGEGHVTPIPEMSARLQLLAAASMWRLPEDTQWNDSRTS